MTSTANFGGCELPYLYKYRPLTGDGMRNLEATLLKGEVFLAAPNKFNDPFDCHPVYAYEGSDEEMCKHLDNRYGTDPENLRRVHEAFATRASNRRVWDIAVERMCGELAAELKRALGIYCLSAVPDHVLMWSHYADQHRGVCLRFSQTSDAGLFRVAQRVAYSDERPILRIVQDSIQTKLEKAFLTKAKDWGYEQEWRVLSPVQAGVPSTGPGVHIWPPEAFDCLIFGARISAEDEASVREIVARRAKPIVLLRAVVDQRHFRIRVEPF